jgi:hypothetical protein
MCQTWFLSVWTAPSEPRAVAERLLLDDLVEPGAELLVPRLGVAAGQFAKLAGAAVVGQVVERMEDRHPEPLRGPDRPDHPPQPVAPWTLDLCIEALVTQARLQQRLVAKTPAQGPLERPTEALPQGVPLLLLRRGRRW